MEPSAQVRMLYGNLLKHQLLAAELDKAKPRLILWSESSYVPLHEVYSRRTDTLAVALAADGRVFQVGETTVRPFEAPGEAPGRSAGARAIAAANEDFLVVVGQRGAAWVYDGKAWKRESTGTDRDLFAVAVSGEGDEVLAVGAQGAAMVRRDGRWTHVDLKTTTDLRGVTWVRGRGFAVCGDAGTLLTWNGRDVRHIDAGTRADLLAIGGSAHRAIGLVAVGKDGEMVRLVTDGTQVPSIAAPYGPLVKATLRGVGVGDMAIGVGDDGAAVGCFEKCSRIATRDEPFVAAGGSEEGRIWAVTARGRVRQLDRQAPRVLGEAGTGLVAVAAVPAKEGYPFPHDVQWIHVSRQPLPAGDAMHPDEAAEADVHATERDRNSVIRGFSSTLLFGAITMQDRPDHPGEKDYFNSALLVRGDGRVLGRYDKNYLLIFGEYLPFADWFPFLRRWVPEAGDFKAGDTVEAFEDGDLRIGVMVCYEDIIPSFTRRLGGKDPNVLVNLTNDAWFGKTAEPYLHLQLATFRAIENRLYLLRATNTGVSAIVDPVGRLVQQTRLDDPETLSAKIAILSGDTLYRRIGDVFPWACCGLSVVLIAVARFRRRAV